MSAIGQFFKRLLSVHLLFWALAFRSFDVLPLFGAIIVAIGWADIQASVKALYIILQFILYVGAFVFCYIWSGFRNNLIGIANNMICLSLCIAVLGAIFAFLIRFMISVSPLAETIGAVIFWLIDALRYLFPWDSRYSLAFLLFLISYSLILRNTIYIFGAHQLRSVVMSSEIVPLVISMLMSLIACFLVLWPLLALIY
jgi:hypothetical protein